MAHKTTNTIERRGEWGKIASFESQALPMQGRLAVWAAPCTNTPRHNKARHNYVKNTRPPSIITSARAATTR